MDNEDQEQFRKTIRNLVETHQELKLHNLRAKQLREQLKSLKAVVLNFMESTELEVCNVSHNGKNGEVFVRKSKRTKSLQKEDAINQIEKYLSEEIKVDEADERAASLWTAIQNTRKVTEHKDVSVKKL